MESGQVGDLTMWISDPVGPSCRLFLHSLSWWLHWLSVGLVIERSRVQLPAGALSSQLGQLSLLSLRDR